MSNSPIICPYCGREVKPSKAWYEIEKLWGGINGFQCLRPCYQVFYVNSKDHSTGKDWREMDDQNKD